MAVVGEKQWPLTAPTIALADLLIALRERVPMSEARIARRSGYE